MYKSLEDISTQRKLTPEERTEMKYYSRLADAFTPLGKGMSSEYANENAYDAIQIHGGSGYMKDYKCERLYRDLVCNIYGNHSTSGGCCNTPRNNRHISATYQRIRSNASSTRA